MAYVPIQKSSKSSYTPIGSSEKKPIEERPKTSQNFAPLSYSAIDTSAKSSTVQKGSGLDTGKFLAAIPQGIMRGGAAAGSAIMALPERARAFLTNTPEKPKTGQFQPIGEAQQAIYGTSEPISLDTSGEEIYKIFGLDSPQGGLPPMLIGAFSSILDLTGAEGVRGFEGLRRAVQAAKTEKAVGAFMRNAGFAEDIIKQYAPLLAKEKDLETVGNGLKAAEKIQNETRPKRSYVPVNERSFNEETGGVIDLSKEEAKIPDDLKALAEEAKKYKSADEFVKAQAPEQTFYRGGGTGSMPKGTAADVLKYEQVELGNADVRAEQGIDLSKIPAQNTIWLTETKEAAKEYGPVSSKKFDAGTYRIIARDDQGGVLLEKTDPSQLTDFYNQVIKAAEKEAPKIDSAPRPQTARDARAAVEETYKAGKTYAMPQKAESGLLNRSRASLRDEEEAWRMQLSLLEDELDNSAAKPLMRFYRRGKDPEDIISYLDERLAKQLNEFQESGFRKRGSMLQKGAGEGGRSSIDKFVEELGFADMDEAQKALQDYARGRKKAEKIRERIQAIADRRRDVDVMLKEARETIRGRQARLRVFQEVHDLTDAEVKEVIGKRDIRTMTNEEFDEFLDSLDQKGMEVLHRRTLRVQLEAMIKEREYKNWENLAKAMKIDKPIAKMSADELTRLGNELDKYMRADEFLPVRLIETLPNTELAGLRTEREVNEFLAKKAGVSYKEVAETIYELRERKPWIKWIDPRAKYDTWLARENPFFNLLVDYKNRSVIQAERRIIDLVKKEDEVIKAARASKPTEAVRAARERLLDEFKTFATKSEKAYKEAADAGELDNEAIAELKDIATAARQKARDFERGAFRKAGEAVVPTDNLIVMYLESGIDERIRLIEAMTPEELRAADFMDDTFRAYYQERVARAAGRKFSRFEDQYFPHIRRDFLEAWKDDGIVKAFGEAFDQFAQEEKYMNILDQKTGAILPYEKWVGFLQRRSGILQPTKNAARAFGGYVRSLEFARHFDNFIPEIMAYVHTLSPKNMSEKGLELDDSLKRFVKEWINAQKGRKPDVMMFRAGSKPDWALRMGVALTRILDLGFNFTTQLAAPFGENMANITMLGAADYAKAVARRATPEGQRIVRSYEEFVGRSFFEELFSAANHMGDTLTKSMFALFQGARTSGNELFLLGKMTDEEFKTGKISVERLAELRKEMGEYRDVEGAASVWGRTSVGASFKQYRSWAGPIVVSTIHNLRRLAQIMKEDGISAVLASKEGKQLFYSTMLGSVIGIGFYGYYKELSNKKDRTFWETAQLKAMQDSLSMIGALNPSLWGSPRVLEFIVDLEQALTAMILLEKYQSGENEGKLKGVVQLGRTVTPSIIKSTLKEINAPSSVPSSSSKTKTKTIKTPKGLPALPKAKTGLPKPKGLPELPKR